jgi:hypothetical protein
MRKSLIAAAAAAVSLVSLAVPALSSAAVGNVDCTDGSLQGETVNSNITVPAGKTCDLSWADVKKNVEVYGSLKTMGITHFEGNVTVHPGGSFGAANWGVTIDKNLQITDPATYSYNGFWGNQGGTTNVVKGSLIYTIDANASYPMYQSPLLYFGGGTTVEKDFTYTDQGVGFAGHLDTGGLHVNGTTSITQP